MIDKEMVSGVETYADRSGERFGDVVTIAHLARYSFRDVDAGKLTAYAAASTIKGDWRDELWALTATDEMALGGIIATFTDGSSLRVITPNRYGKPVESYWRHMGPGGVPAHELAQWDGDILVNRGAGVPLWGGKGEPPAIGEIVPLAGRGDHLATITGYMVDSGWLMALAYRTAEPSKRGNLAGTEIRYATT